MKSEFACSRQTYKHKDNFIMIAIFEALQHKIFVKATFFCDVRQCFRLLWAYGNEGLHRKNAATCKGVTYSEILLQYLDK